MRLQRWWWEKNPPWQAPCWKVLQQCRKGSSLLLSDPWLPCDILVPRGERFQMERGMHKASLGCLDLKSAQSGEGMGMMEEPPPGIRR